MKAATDVLATLHAIGCGWAEDAIDLIESQAARIAELEEQVRISQRDATELFLVCDELHKRIAELEAALKGKPTGKRGRMFPVVGP